MLLNFFFFFCFHMSEDVTNGFEVMNLCTPPLTAYSQVNDNKCFIAPFFFCESLIFESAVMCYLLSRSNRRHCVKPLIMTKHNGYVWR